MSTILFKSDTAFTDTSLPVLKIDDIMADNGALLLMDASLNTENDFIGQASGKIRNLAWANAQILMPAETEESLKLVTSKLINVNEGLVELSSKKGIHTIISQTVAVIDHGLIINLPDSLKSYILSHIANSFYVSIWGRTTRATLDSANQFSTHGISHSSINSGKLVLSLPAGYSPTNPTLGSSLIGGDRILGNFLRTYASIYSGTIPPNIASMIAYFQYGSRDPYKGFDVNKSASGILYKIYIEDLTVSGRTFATVNAIDQALYSAAFTAGGRFADDTFTAPSTIA